MAASVGRDGWCAREFGSFVQQNGSTAPCEDGTSLSPGVDNIFFSGLEDWPRKRECLSPRERVDVQVRKIAENDLLSRLLESDNTTFSRVIKPFFEVRDIGNLMGVSRAFLEVEENEAFQAECRINPFSLSIIRCYRNISQLGERRWKQVQSYFPEATVFSCNGRIQKGALITDDEVIALVKHFSRLTDVFLTLCPNITSTAIVAIANNCPNLRVIELPGSPITDIALEAIAKHCKCLTRIDLDGCKQITRNGVGELAKRCQMLRHISLYGCSPFVQRVAPDLKNQYPALRVTWEQSNR